MRDEEFEGLDEERYPGSRYTRRSLHKTREEAKAVASIGEWDSKPIRKIVGGQPKEFFTVGALAVALGKSVVTVRLWERKGVLPAAQYRTPNKNGKGGRRLYTREQITGIVAIAAEEGMLRPRAEYTQQFTNRIVDLFRRLKGDGATSPPSGSDDPSGA